MATIPNPEKLENIATESLENEVQDILNACEKALFAVKPPLPEKVIVNIFHEISPKAIEEVTSELNQNNWKLFVSTEHLPHSFDFDALTTLVLEKHK